MRRSQAPSMRRASKISAPASELSVNKKVFTEMEWGTPGGYKGFRPRKYGNGENPLKERRIFLVLWRKQSNKKHKTWKGNGSLEVTATRATLKDEIGKVLDVLTSFKPEKMQADALLEIGMRDVEIQVELTTVEECIAQRQEEIENWYRQQEESDGLISQGSDPNQKPQRSMTMLKRPKLSHQTKSVNEINDYSIQAPAAAAPPPTTPPTPIQLNEYICMLEPAELQSQMMHLLADHCRELGTQLPTASEDIIAVAQLICDHPVLLKHMVNQPLVSELLLPHLPPWQEMGLYDSGKFEFVHLMLDNLVVARGEKCAIVANSQMCLDLIKGYCQCWDIPYIQLEDSMQASCFNTSSMENGKSPMVALLMGSELPAIRLTCCKHMILYNYSARLEAIQMLAADADAQIYTLITSGCLEEQQYQQHLGLIDGSDILMDSLNLRVNSTHQLLGVAQSTLASWKQWQPPFSETFLQETFLLDELPSLRFVFSKQTAIVACNYQ